MHLYRKTAVVQFELFSGATEGSLPLATERDFGVILTIEGITYPAQSFRSPINDEQWRQFDRKLRDCNITHDATMYRNAASIRSLAHQLYQSLVTVSPAVREFLGRTGEPRRLVIQTTRPELHLLPWAAIIDDTGAFLAAGDLSVVQAWEKFTTMESTTGNKLRLMTVLGEDTRQVTASSVQDLPKEIEVVNGSAPVDSIDIVHLEEHGNAVTNVVGDEFATALATRFAQVPIALLWSCCSGATNSWGESPALCLHQKGAGFVLSFLAELHNLDAQSISTAFYREVFGPAASRDPETALVRIRADKFANEFAFANWASMTVYMRAPVDMSALPLNGPRVPRALWSDDEAPAETDSCSCAETAPAAVADGTSEPNSVAAQNAAAVPSAEPSPATTPAASQGPTTTSSPAATPTPKPPDLWARLATAVSQLQPGTLDNDFHGFEDLPADTTARLPMSAFKAWRGNVIRLDGAEEPLSVDTIQELNLSSQDIPQTDAAERLVWFFKKIERYGSPLIVWTNATLRHLNFLQNADLSSTLTFLVIYGPQPAPTLIDLVNEDKLDEAQSACASLPDPCGDDLLSAAYFAFARSEDTEKAVRYIGRVSSTAEKLLLMANFISRRGIIPNPRQDWMLEHPDGKLTNLQQQHCQEDYFRKVISDPGTEAPLRESGRAKHQLGYLLNKLGKTSVGEMLFGQALADLEKCPKKQHDYRWHLALGQVLRDWADLLSQYPDRLEKARELLSRAMAIHSFHGRRLQIAYCLDTAARIALAGRRFSEAIQNAVDSANLFEVLKNWRGWGEAMKVLFDCLAETRETGRMHSLANLAIDKLQSSNLPHDQRDRLRRAFIYEKANANWIAGTLAEARSELEKLGLGSADGTKAELDPEFEAEVKRLWRFLAISPQ
jgi:tetratricopeptide (TPR) repeat protein